MENIYIDSDDEKIFDIKFQGKTMRFYKKDTRIYDLVLSVMLTLPIDLIKIIYEYTHEQINCIVKSLYFSDDHISMNIDINNVCNIFMSRDDTRVYRYDAYFKSSVIKLYSNPQIIHDIYINSIDFFDYYMFKMYGMKDYCDVITNYNVKCNEYQKHYNDDCIVFNFSVQDNIYTMIYSYVPPYCGENTRTRIVEDHNKLTDVIMITKQMIRLFRVFCEKIEPS